MKHQYDWKKGKCLENTHKTLWKFIKKKFLKRKIYDPKKNLSKSS